MTRTLKLELAVLAVIAIGLSLASPAAAQGSRVDPTLAKRGKQVWEKNGCYMCHAFNAVRAGPDLMGIMDRRDNAWLRKWLKNTNDMLANDDQAMAMLETYRGAKMPNFNMKDSDIDALFQFFAQETAKVRSTGGGN